MGQTSALPPGEGPRRSADEAALPEPAPQRTQAAMVPDQHRAIAEVACKLGASEGSLGN